MTTKAFLVAATESGIGRPAGTFGIKIAGASTVKTQQFVQVFVALGNPGKNRKVLDSERSV
jgi:hypothetical protein